MFGLFNSRYKSLPKSDSGTVAIWYSPKPTTPEVKKNELPKLDLHVNLWRIAGVSKRNFETSKYYAAKGPVTYLDLGLELKNIENIAQINIFIPAQLDKKDVLDMSPTLKNQQTLKAVFNDIVEISNTTDDSFTVKKQNNNNNWARRIWMLQDGDTKLEDVSDDRYPGKILTFKETILKRIQESPRDESCVDYIRIRLVLSPGNQRFCITELSANTFGLNPRDAYQETIEFRLNERRSFPEDIEARANGGRFLLASVNYFLITNTKQEITTQHTQFKRVRQLEMPLWLDYIIGYMRGESASTGPSDASPSSAHRTVTTVQVPINFNRLKRTNLSIYQWKEKSQKIPAGVDNNDIGIDDFSAYATFASTKSTIVSYILIALLIGVFSSLMSTFLTPLMSTFVTPWICKAANVASCQEDVQKPET